MVRVLLQLGWIYIKNPPGFSIERCWVGLSGNLLLLTLLLFRPVLLPLQKLSALRPLQAWICSMAGQCA